MIDRTQTAGSGNGRDRGAAMIVVLLVLVMFVAIGSVLLLQSRTEKIVVTNEQDHLKTFQAADAGLSWGEKLILDQGNGFTSFLVGPDASDAADDYLLGLRDLSLTSTAQFTDANEGTASAIVSRDFFGSGSESYEAIRLPDGTDRKTLVYLRVDDNFDDDPDVPANNDPLTDTDNKIKLTVVAEHPVYVDGSGVEIASNIDDRPRARSAVAAWYAGSPGVAAVVVNNDLDVPGGPMVCGECGSMHANHNYTSGGSAELCKNVTATGTANVRQTSLVGGNIKSAQPRIPVPVINPMDDIFVPEPAMFDKSGDLSLPVELRCAGPSTSDPGNAKYFAFVPINDGYVYKAYWDFGNDRWRWKMIDEIDDGTVVLLDPCGRAPGDPNYTVGVTSKPGVPGGDNKSFYGLKLKSSGTDACASCGTAGDDNSLCQLANNDFNRNGHYDENGTFQSSPVLPGNFQPDGTLDFDAERRYDSKQWEIGVPNVHSPLYNSVLYFKGNLDVSQDLHGSNPYYCGIGSCPVKLPLPGSVTTVSMIAEGYINVQGRPAYRPLDTQTFPFLLIAGRDVEAAGSAGSGDACPSICHSSPPGPAEAYSGIIAAHEQVRISGSPNVMGFLLAESASECDPFVDGDGRGASELLGDFHIYYDCNNPPNPWTEDPRRIDWHEIP